MTWQKKGDRLMEKGRLIVISGPSGAGKGTIVKAVTEKNQEVALSVSCTTRDKRPGETHGQTYYFISEEEFTKTKGKQGFLEDACVYGNYYGTPKDLVMEKINQGVDVILEIDIQGAMAVKRNYPQGVFIFILPPSMAELRKRITSRGRESQQAIEERLSAALGEVAYIDKYDYCVINGTVEEAANRVSSIIVAEHSKVTKDVYKLIEGYKEEV